MLDQLQEYISRLLSSIDENPITLAIIAIIAAVMVASIIKYILIVGLKRIMFRTKIDLGNDILDLLSAPIYYTVLFIGLSSALIILQPSETFIYVESAILKSLGLIIWTFFFLKLNNVLLKRLSNHPSRFKAINTKTLPLFQNLLSIIIIVLAVYLIFSVWDIDMTAWLASAGIVGIAVGFAAKDTLANLFSGVFIMADAPYKVGDYVILDSTDRGEITHIGIRSTRMLTRDDIEITVPNSVMGNSKIINESGGRYEKSRCRIALTLAHNCDIDLVRSVLMSIAKNGDLVCKDPEPRVRFRRFTNAGLNFELLVWVEQPALKGRMIDALNCEIYKQFRMQEIEIPYAKQDLYIREFPVQKPTDPQ